MRVLLNAFRTGDRPYRCALGEEIVGKHVTEFEARLKEAQVEHVYTTLPGGTHSMFVWRPALKSFHEQIFRR
jgi:enterochelin esterase-like enzyme